MSRSHNICPLTAFVHLAVVSPDEAEICPQQPFSKDGVPDRDHSPQNNTDPARDIARELEALLPQAQEKAMEARGAAERLQRIMASFEDNFNRQKELVRQAFGELRESLSRREQEMLDQLTSRHTWAQAALARQKSELQDLGSRLESAESRAKVAAEHGDDLTMLVFKSELSSKGPGPLSEPTLHFRLPPGLCDTLSKIGSVSLRFQKASTNVESPLATFKLPPAALESSASNSTVQSPIAEIPDILPDPPTPRIGAEPSTPRCEDKNNRAPPVWSPRTPDRRLGIHSRRPSLVSGQFVRAWGTPGTGPGQFSLPYDVAVASNGEVFVADKDNHRIQVFRSDGAFLRKWGVKGSEQGEMRQPWGIALADGAIYVTEYSSHRIQVFNPDGTFIKEWGSKGSGQGQFLYPQFLSVSDGLIYVADADRVQVFRLDGTYVRVLGASGPCGVAVINGEIFVSEYHNHRIRVFRPDGTCAGGWGAEGSGPGQFKYPYGVGVSRAGEILVADSGNDRVQVFRADGLFLRELRGGDGRRLSHPQGVAVSTDGEIYVTDWNHRVLVFR